MLRHMCPPLGLGKRCPARVAYKVRGEGRGGVNLSVAVSFVLFWFPFSSFPCTAGGGLVGVVALCIDVGAGS